MSSTQPSSQQPSTNKRPAQAASKPRSTPTSALRKLIGRTATHSLVLLSSSTQRLIRTTTRLRTLIGHPAVTWHSFRRSQQPATAPQATPVTPHSHEPGKAPQTDQQRLIREGNIFFVRWISLSLIVLALALTLMLTGIQDYISNWQIQLLCREPFLIEAQRLQAPLLSAQGIFTACTIVTLYLSLVMLREPRWGKRTQLAFLAAAVLTMPGLLCVFWSGIINPFAPVCCVVALWLLTSLIPFYMRRPTSM